MGSSASSESQAHQNPDDREPQGTVKMTISSKFVEPENKGRQNSRERTGNAQSQRQQRAESSNEGSGAQRPQQKRSNNASTQAIQGFGSNISPSNYESTLEADLEAIKDLVSSVKVPENPKPHLSDKIADVARETMESSTKKLEIEETAVINEVQNLFTKINAVPQVPPFHEAASYSREPICSFDYAAATECIKTQGPSSCVSLMQKFAQCSENYHLKLQSQEAKLSRHL